MNFSFVVSVSSISCYIRDIDISPVGTYGIVASAADPFIDLKDSLPVPPSISTDNVSAIAPAASFTVICATVADVEFDIIHAVVLVIEVTFSCAVVYVISPFDEDTVEVTVIASTLSPSFQ